MKIINKTLLGYEQGASNKVYNVYLVEVSRNKYVVNFEYGRFGATLREGSKTSTPLDRESAQKIYDSLVVSKLNKDYVMVEGYDATKPQEQKEQVILDSRAYKEQLLQRLRKVGEIEQGHFKKVDNYEVSRLIYRAGELHLLEAKEIIVALYEQQTKEENAFYYSVAWTLGRYRDASLRPVLESLRTKLNDSSKYIVEEALFLLNEEHEARQIRELMLPMPYSASLKAKNQAGFVEQVTGLTDIIEEIYVEYNNIDSWYGNQKKQKKKELMPLLSKLDELYLKLYMWASIDQESHENLMAIVHLLPINELNFSLFRRLYKVAEFRNDQAVLGAMVSQIESKKMNCYQTYDYHKRESVSSVGCSKQYFKKRSFRYVKDIEVHQEEAYLSFAKSVLLSLNYHTHDFKPFTLDYYDGNWNWKTKKYDAFARHLTFMHIVYGGGQRYALDSNRMMWEIANKNIKDEHRPERQKALWDKHPEVALEILSKSKVLEVQNFAFNILKENVEALNGVSIALLLQMMNLKLDEARTFFFNVLKEKYAQSKDQRIIKAFVLSEDENISAFALNEIVKNPQILLMDKLMIELIEKCGQKTIDKIISIVPNIKNPRAIVDDIMHKLATDAFPFNEIEVNRMFMILTQLQKEINVEDILTLMKEDELNERHLFAAKMIRLESLEHLTLPLELKEKIAKYNHPEMLATTIYLLGKLSSQELMKEYEMLVAFLYHEEKAVHKEARKIIENLAKNEADGGVLLQAIVDKSFLSASDRVAKNVSMSVKSMKQSDAVINPDQLYRMLIAKSKLAELLGGLILSKSKAEIFSVVQWARLAKNPNKSVRIWAYDAYLNHPEKVKDAMPKSLMIFDTHWEDTRTFASGYFESIEMSTDDIVVIADSNYVDVQHFAKKVIDERNLDVEVLLTKLSQHPAVTIQKFVTDLMLSDMSDEQLLKMERFFNTLLHSVNTNRVAKTRVMMLINKRLESEAIAKMYARLASHHAATMVWADKTVYVEAMSYIKEVYPDIELPLSIIESEEREAM